MWPQFKGGLRYLCRYPDLDVFTAVSTSPSLPAIQWKKNSWAQQDYKNSHVSRSWNKMFVELNSLSHSRGTHKKESFYVSHLASLLTKISPLHNIFTLSSCTCGLMPVRNLPETKPPAPGAGSYGWKQGKDFPEGISGGLRPSNSIWPSRHEIWKTHRHTYDFMTFYWIIIISTEWCKDKFKVSVFVCVSGGVWGGTCMVFTVDPLAPDWTISWRLLSGKEVWSPTGMHTFEHTWHTPFKNCAFWKM